MRFRKVSIIGLGLIGGSLARALKASGEVGEVAGADSDPKALEYALAEGVVDAGFAEAERAVAESELVVLATRVALIPELAAALSPHLSRSAVLTDVGSVKRAIVERVTRLLPRGVPFVGGHPIAGTEKSGVWNSHPGLFSGKPVVLTPTEDTSPRALSRVRALWELVGARVVAMEPAGHDRVFAFVSHLPHALAYSLVNTVLEQREPPGMREYAGGGLQDFTRIAESSPEMWRDIFLMNGEELARAIEGFQAVLERLLERVRAGDGEGVLEELRKSALAKRSGTWCG